MLDQPALQRDIALVFEKRGAPDFVEVAPADHGRIDTRRIWCSAALNACLEFPRVGQLFVIERQSNLSIIAALWRILPMTQAHRRLPLVLVGDKTGT